MPYSPSGPIVHPSGPKPSRFYFLGEAPGKQEVDQGKGFVGRAGAELWGALRWWGTGLNRGNVRIGNACWEWPGKGNPDPAQEALAYWRPQVLQDIQDTNPEVVVCLGRIALSCLLGSWQEGAIGVEVEEDILEDEDGDGVSQEDVSSTIRPLEKVNGLLLCCKIQAGTSGGFPLLVLPTFHPASGLHSPDLYKWFYNGLGRVKRYLDGDTAPLEDKIIPCYRRASRGLGAPIEGRAGVDTEFTSEGPLGASWSLLEGDGEWGDGWSPLFRHAIFHNSLADLRQIEALGGRVDHFEDTMVKAHICGETRVGLKALAYRLCGVEMEDYEEVVAPAQKRLALEYLNEIASTYVPEYQERISEKTGKRLKPKLMPKGAVYKAVARCMKHEDPFGLWGRQKNPEVHREARRLAKKDMPVASLEDVD